MENFKILIETLDKKKSTDGKVGGDFNEIENLSKLHLKHLLNEVFLTRSFDERTLIYLSYFFIIF